jgi:enoyl-CoA hydratase
MTQQWRQPGIEIEQRGRVLLARIHGGPRGEFGREIGADLAALVARAEKDDEVGAVVLTGAHPERFVAHAELSWLQQAGAETPTVGPKAAGGIVRLAGVGRHIPGFRQLLARTPLSGAMELVSLHDTLLRMNTSGAVFVAALNGSALGVGSELALACDYRLMAAGNSVIGQPEILVGFPPAGGGTQRLTRLVGTHKGLKIMLEGGSLSPEAAAEIGYVDEVVDPDQLLELALARADRLAQRLKYAVKAVKRTAYLGASMSLAEGLQIERAEFLSAVANPEAQKSMIAYLEQTAATGDLPLYDSNAYQQAANAGHFG